MPLQVGERWIGGGLGGPFGPGFGRQPAQPAGAGDEPDITDPGYLDWLRERYPPRPGYDYRLTVDDWGEEIIVDEYALDEGGANASRYNAELDYQLGLKQLEVDWAEARTQQAMAAEAARSNRASEAENARRRALDAASDAAGAYLQGTQLADARRLASFQEARQLLPYLVSPGQEYQAGLAPGGALAVASARRGLPFTPQRLPTQTFDPAELARAPSEQQIGAGVLEQIEPIRQGGR